MLVRFAQNPQTRLQWYTNWKCPDGHAQFRKGTETRDQIANICWIIEKAREFQKNIYFCFTGYAKAFDYMDHSKLWKILQEMTRPFKNQTILPASWEICMRVKKQQSEMDMEQQTGSKLRKDYDRAVCCLFNYKLSTS